VEFILGGGISGMFGFGPGEFGPEDVARVSTTLAFYCLGIWAYCGVHVVVRGFYALRDTLTPVKVVVWLVALNIPLNLILIWPLGTGGLALSTAICAALNLVILTRLLSRRIEKLPMGSEQADQVRQVGPLREVGAALPRIVLATVLMGGAAYGALVLSEKWVGSAVGLSGVRLGGAVLAGVLVYYLSARLLGCKELDELLGRDS